MLTRHQILEPNTVLFVWLCCWLSDDISAT